MKWKNVRSLLLSSWVFVCPSSSLQTTQRSVLHNGAFSKKHIGFSTAIAGISSSWCTWPDCLSIHHPAEIRDSNMVCNCPQYLCLFHIVFECIPTVHDQKKMLVIPNQRLSLVLSTWDPCFVSFQPILSHPHTQIRITLSDAVRTSIPPNHVAKGFSQIAFLIPVMPKDDRTDFAHEERLGLPYWTMILATCVVVDESNCVNTPILEFLTISEYLPFFLGCWLILRQLLVLRNQAVWRWYPWFWRLSFVMLKILVQWILHKILNHLSQCRLEAQLDLCIFWCFASNSAFSNDICPSVRRNALLRPSSLLHRSPLSYFWRSSGSTPKFSPIFPIPCPLLPLLREFSWLEA